MLRASSLWSFVFLLATITFSGTICRGDPGWQKGKLRDEQTESVDDPEVRVLADERLRDPLSSIAAEFQRRSGLSVGLDFQVAEKVKELAGAKSGAFDVVVGMSKRDSDNTVWAGFSRATKVAWKLDSGDPVRAAVIGKRKDAAEFVRFVGGPTGHRLWSESTAGFTIVSGRTHAESIDWIAENRVKHTYPLTAVRMLSECGGIREGICIDIGCGTGSLDIELAKLTQLTIIGLDIDAEMKPLFEKRIGDAGFRDRIRFVAGDAQDLPFKSDFADIIVSRGTLPFIPDIGRCLQEVDRVLKPTGVAFLGGRYVYTPQKDKISTNRLREIVAESGVAGARVVDQRGQWVKIIGPEAPQAARQVQAGPHMLVNRFIADYVITKGECLVVCSNDGAGVRQLQQGFVSATDLKITALYPSQEIADAALKRIREGNLSHRISCKVGTLDELPPQIGSFDLVAGIGPVLIWGDREKKMRAVYRVLETGGAALLGGRYLGMPAGRRVSSEDLHSAVQTGISSIRVIDDQGQWVEIRKGIRDRGLRD